MHIVDRDVSLDVVHCNPIPPQGFALLLRIRD